MKLLGKRLLVERLPPVDMTKSGLYLPSTFTDADGDTAPAKEAPQWARVIAIGHKSRLKREVNVGDLVLIPKYSDRVVPMGDARRLVIYDDEPYAVLVEK